MFIRPARLCLRANADRNQPKRRKWRNETKAGKPSRKLDVRHKPLQYGSPRHVYGLQGADQPFGVVRDLTACEARQREEQACDDTGDCERNCGVSEQAGIEKIA